MAHPTAGFGPPPKLPTYKFVNTSRIKRFAKCELAGHLDYHTNVQYAPERPTTPKMWLGSAIHAWIEALHTHGWDYGVDLVIHNEEFEGDPEGDRVNTIAAPIMRAYRDKYRGNQTYDKVLASEQPFWVLWQGVCFLGTIDALVEKDGKTWVLDTKTTGSDLTEMGSRERLNIQWLVYCEAIDRLYPNLGGVIIDGISTDIPLKKEPRITKSGAIHATDKRLLEEYAQKMAEYQAFGLQRFTFRELAKPQVRASRMFRFGVWDTIKRIESLRTGILEPISIMGVDPWSCRSCAHRQYCEIEETPGAHDYYTRQPDYVDLAREANQ